MTAPIFCLVLRLAAPLQSWGDRSQYNRRETASEPTKSGIVGLLAAAQGRRRHDPIEDLLSLRLGVRIDQPGSLLRDYHTVSDYRDRPLLSASVAKSGLQKPTSPAKATHVTTRFYLQDAVFVAAVAGPLTAIAALRDAIRRPAFPLALGRRACVPTHPLLLTPQEANGPAGNPGTGQSDVDGLWSGDPLTVLRAVPWQASEQHRRQRRSAGNPPAVVDLPVTVDDPAGGDVRMDLPRSFDPLARSFTARPVRHDWAHLPTGFAAADSPGEHDPFALLGW